MKRWWLLAPVIFMTSCFELYSCLRGGGGTCCSARATVAPRVTYEGLIPPGDGGPNTTVRFVTEGEVARLTFVRDGVEIVETFTLR